jgi:ribosomal protein S20
MAQAAAPPAEQLAIARLPGYIRALQTRLWGQRALTLLLRGGATVAGLLLLARLLAALGAAGAADAVLLLAGMAAMGVVVAAVRSRPSEQAAARAADRALDLRERLSTALELSQAGVSSNLAALQLADAAAVAGRYRPAEAVRPLVHWRDVLLAVLASGLAVVTWVALPDLSGWGRAPGQAASERPAEVSPTDLTENNVGDILASIEETRRRAQARQIDPTEAARLLAQAEARLNARLEASTREQQNLQQLADQLRRTAVGQEVAGAIDRGDYSGAADQLNQLARESDQLSPQARRELAQALERAAQQTQQNAGLREAERRAAQALNRGDYRETERAMRNLGDQIAMAGREVVPQNELGRAQSRLDQARQELGLGGNQGDEEQGQPARTGQPAAGGQQPGRNASGSQPGTQPGQNRPGSSGQEAQPGQQGQPPGSGNQRSGELPQQENRGSDRLGVGGRPLELESPDSAGQLRPSTGQGEQRGSQLLPVRPATGMGVAQPTDPVESPADFTRVSPERRPAVRSYFTPTNR